ncbi:recombinase [Pseudomonas fluorescens]|uniref:Recombinase n=1 Tax=Pseudomonas fluorescens TaxID=294 RepID=A0A379IE77_PSEFL|nr:recombinase family protein [Pseudomonas fluorescens]SUD31084.1 recombinase [Pseudomonas fluorescens]
MPKAISYIRFSTGKQAKGSSHERQTAMLSRWLDDNPGYPLWTESFKDLGISGFSGKHLESGFGLLLAAIENGSIQSGDVILIEAIDRIGRLEPMDMLPIVSRIVKAGVDIVTLDGGARYSRESANSTNLFMLVAQIQQAHQYSDALSRRMKASYASRRKAAVEGVTPKRNTPVWLTSEGALIEDIAPLVKQAFEDYASGLGERRIFERILERSDHPLLSRMAPSTVKRWMNNRTAIGEWNGIADVYPAVIAPELFYRVQKRMEDKFRLRGAPTKHRYTGLVVCGECGKNFNTKVFTTSKQAVMECSSRARRGSVGCSNARSIPEPVIALAYAMSSPAYAIRALQGQVLSVSQKRAIEIDGQLGELNKKIKRAVALLTELDDDGDEMLQEFKRLKAEAKVLQSEKDGLIDDSVTLKDRLADIGNFNQDPIKANALLQSVGYKMVCYPDGSIATEEGTFRYEGWGRAKDVHKVRWPDGTLFPLPIHRVGKERPVSTTVVDRLKALRASDVATSLEVD